MNGVDDRVRLFQNSLSSRSRDAHMELLLPELDENGRAMEPTLAVFHFTLRLFAEERLALICVIIANCCVRHRAS